MILLKTNVFFPPPAERPEFTTEDQNQQSHDDPEEEPGMVTLNVAAEQNWETVFQDFTRSAENPETDDVAETLRGWRRSSLDLTGLTPHRSLDDIQRERWEKGQTIAEKLRQQGLEEESRALRDCHSFWTIRRCAGCQDVTKFWNRCDRLICPTCAPRLASKRLEGLDWWIKKLHTPKHVVLTFRNVTVLTSKYLAQCQARLQALRRLKKFRCWKAGFWALEITNRGNGWHVHYHILIESPWFSQAELSASWKHLTNEESYIVHVSDAGRDGALKRLPRYIAAYTSKGCQIETWRGEQLAEFAKALKGVRSFGVFGELYGKRKEFADWKIEARGRRRACECGCNQYQYFSELEWFVEREFDRGPPKTPDRPKDQTELDWNWTQWFNRHAVSR